MMIPPGIPSLDRLDGGWLRLSTEPAAPAEETEQEAVLYAVRTMHRAFERYGVRPANYVGVTLLSVIDHLFPKKAYLNFGLQPARFEGFDDPVDTLIDADGRALGVVVLVSERAIKEMAVPAVMILPHVKQPESFHRLGG